MIIVSNTSPLTNLAAIGRLNLLQQLYAKIIIPVGVYQELLNAGEDELATLKIQHLDWIKVESVTNLALLSTLQAKLDCGEAEAIVLALELNADRLIIDERRGRTQAVDLGLKITGLLGILLAAKQAKLIPLVQPVLDELIAHGFWIRDQLYAEVLKLAGE